MPQFPACDKNKVGECDMLQPAESVIRELDGQIIVVVGGGVEIRETHRLGRMSELHYKSQPPPLLLPSPSLFQR